MTTIADPDAALRTYEALDQNVRTLPNVIIDWIDGPGRVAIRAKHEALPSILKYTVAPSAIAFFAIKRLVFPQHAGEQPSARWATAVPPLTRTFVDSLIGLSFMFEHPGRNVDRYVRAGLCKELGRYRRLQDEYGTDTEWQPYLRDHRAWLDSWTDIGLTDDEMADPHSHAQKLWPNPGRLIQGCGPARQLFLRSVRDWYYDELSQDTHLTFMGMIRRGSLMNEVNAGLPNQLNRVTTFYTALAFYWALLTEIALEIGMREERAILVRVWQALASFTDPDRLWRWRYRELLDLDQ